MKKRLSLFLILLLFLLSSCMRNDRIISSMNNMKKPDIKNLKILSNANPEYAQRQEVANLYFRYENQDILVPETREISVRNSEIPEYAILKELLKGPREGNGHLKSTINKDINILSAVNIKNNILAITVSENILKNTMQYSVLERKLMLNAICLSITDNFPYIGIQIFVKPDNEEEASYRLKNSFLGGNDDIMLPLTRDDLYISNPMNIADRFAKAISLNDIETLSYYIDTQSNYTSLQKLIEGVANIDEYSIGSGSITSLGNKCTLSLKLNLDNSKSSIVFPLTLVNNGGIWLVDNNSFNTLLEVLKEA